MRISDWSSDVCSSDLPTVRADPKDTPPQPSPAFAGEGAEKIAAEAAPATACCCHAADSASSASTCSASCFGVASVLSSSIASTGPTHAGQPALQSQAATSSRARCTSSPCRCHSGSLRPTPPGKLSYRYTVGRSEEHTSELQSLMRISYAVFCLKKKKQKSQKQ